MGFGDDSTPKRQAVMLHRAARRALTALGREDGKLSRDEWESYCASCSNVSEQSQRNLNWRLQKLQLIEIADGRVEEPGVIVLHSDYAHIVMDD